MRLERQTGPCQRQTHKHKNRPVLTYFLLPSAASVKIREHLSWLMAVFPYIFSKRSWKEPKKNMKFTQCVEDLAHPLNLSIEIFRWCWSQFDRRDKIWKIVGWVSCASNNCTCCIKLTSKNMSSYMYIYICTMDIREKVWLVNSNQNKQKKSTKTSQISD